MYTVEKGVPLPDSVRRDTKYPFKTMDVGDSFTVAKDLAQKLKSASAYHRRRYRMRFMIAADKDSPETLVRIWRTE